MNGKDLRDIAKALQARNCRAGGPERLVELAAKIRGVHINEVYMTRSRGATDVKKASVYLIRRLYPLASYPDIARMLGLFSHVSVMDHEKRVGPRLVRDDSFRGYVVAIYLAVYRERLPVQGRDAERFLRDIFKVDPDPS